VAALDAGLFCQGGTTASWTANAGANEKLPISCPSWYESFAFCAWDGGFLLSEAEWNYAAAGGALQREYPWGSVINVTYANYACYGDGVVGCTLADVLPVGHYSPQGDGYWGQSDFAGNLNEWVLDWHSANYPQPCIDCAALTATVDRVYRGGGISSSAIGLYVSARFKLDPTKRNAALGIRCGRVP
jgi:sulfatase modifying factor 1